MLTLLFTILMIWILGKMIGLAFRAAWGVTRIVFNVILLPVFLIGLVAAGFMYIALPILIVIGVIMLFVKAVS